MKKKGRTKWRIHVESTCFLEVKKDDDREDAFSEIRRSDRSWRCRSAFIKNVPLLKYWRYCWRIKKKKIEEASWWSLNDWISILETGWGVKKRFPYCLNPNSLDTFCFSGISQEIQEVMLLILSYFLRIYWVHLPYQKCKWNEFNNQKWIDPERTKFQTRKTIRDLHDSNPDGRWKWYGRDPYNLTKSRIAPYKNTWKRLQNCCIFGADLEEPPLRLVIIKNWIMQE